MFFKKEVDCFAVTSFDESADYEKVECISEFTSKKKEFIQLHNEMKENLLASEFKNMKIGDRSFAELVKPISIFTMEVKS